MSSSNQVTSETVEFRVFWEFIAAQLGDAWLSLNPQATRLNNLIEISYDPKDYLRQVIIQSYKKSKCNHLNSPICLNVLLDILGETAYKLRGEKRDDLFDIELLEEIAWYVADRYGHLLVQPTEDASSDSTSSVLSFPNYRIRKANARL